MELRDRRTGYFVRLTPTGYQFSNARDGFDANWLEIRGAVHSETQDWTFHDPSRLTWDAHSIGRWLRGVAAGTTPLAGPPDPDADPQLSFTEPNLGFGLVSSAPDAVIVRVHLRLESAPPVPPGEEPNSWGYWIELELDRAELPDVADRWEAELATYPERNALA